MYQKVTKTKKLLTVAMLLVFCTFANKVLAWTGTGTAADPWLIGDGQTNTASAVKAKLVDRTLTIFGTGNMADFYYSTEGEAPWWFDTTQRNAIQFVTIENGVTNIGDRAFKDCANLASVTIPNSVSIIGQQSFYNCTSLYALVIPSTTTTIEDEAFYNCTGLLSIADMRATPQNINSNVFQGVTVNNIYLATPKEATAAYQSASVWSGFKFVAPYVLINENLGSSLNEAVIGLDGSAFYFEYQGNNSNIPKLLTVYDGISDSIKMIVAYNSNGDPYRLFHNNTMYCIDKNADNTYNITSVDSNGNSQYKNDISINIPQTDDNVRSLATKSAGIVLNAIGEKFVDSGTDLMDISDLIISALGVDNLMPPSVKAIYTGYMATFNVVSAFTSCGDMIFWASTGAGLPIAFLSSAACVTSIYNSIQSIHQFILALEALNGNTGCSVSASLYGSSLTISGSGALCADEINKYTDKKDQITTLIIGSGVTDIPGYAFDNYNNLTTVTIENSQNDLTFSLYYPLIGCPIQTLNLGRNIVDCYNTFAGNTSLKTVNITGNNVTTIENSTFKGCTGLSSINLPNSITAIGSNAFDGCGNLTSINLPNSITTINTSTFSDCGLISITIPENITSISSYAFANCDNLRTVTIENGQNDLTFDLYYPLTGCPIQTLNLGRNIVNCYNTFAGNTSLKTVNITGNYVTTIENSTFKDCTGLAQITSSATIPPIIQSNTFYNVSKNIPVYVPCSYVNKYQTADYWKEFTNYQCGVQITPESNSAVVSFPKIDNAVNYTLDIYSDENQSKLVNELHLDANGNLRAAQQTISCTVPGLNANTQYYYSLTPYDANGNILTIFTGNFTTTNSTAINAIESSALKIYPNPTKDKIFIMSELPIEKVEICSLTGTLLILENNFTEKISVSALPQGVYLLNIHTNKELIIRKFVKN